MWLITQWRTHWLCLRKRLITIERYCNSLNIESYTCSSITYIHFYRFMLRVVFFSNMKLNFTCCECVQNSLSATKKCSSKSIEIDLFLAYVVHYVRRSFECSINKSFFNVAGNTVHFLDYGLKQNTVFHVSLLKCKVHYKKSHASLMV